MNLAPNEGTRPSRLELARRAVGEIPGEIPDAIAAELDAARAAMGPFDPAAIRARAAGVGVGPPAVARPANRGWIGGLVLAACALLATFALLRPDAPTVGVRGGHRLSLYALDGGRLAPWDGRALAAGDVIGVRVDPADASGVVVLSVDGSGATTVFWPESGAGVEPVSGDEWIALPGTITLDGAPGPEVFVAVFDRPADGVEAEAAAAWKAGGAEGVAAWGDEVGDAVVVDRR